MLTTMIIKQSKLAISVIFTVIASTSVVYADGFYTIIGPDGRPMIIPKKPTENENRTDKVIRSNDVDSPAASEKNLPVRNNVKLNLPTISMSKQDAVKNAVKMQSSSESKLASDAEVVHQPKSQNTSKEIIDANTNKKITPKLNVASKSLTNIEAESSASSAFIQVDGIEYVNNEYLEDQEFNLEGKKRFYTMPDGTGRLETIERKKGVSRSILDKILNKSNQSLNSITLSNNYVRLSAQDLSLAFENDRCFLESYSKNKTIKSLVPEKEIGLWPRKPIKEKFEYELVKLDQNIQYMQFDSYASNTDKPTYYWPLVIFLDKSGCILEGVSGFKNQKIPATLLQHAALQGVIKIPPKSYYMMMTPLASAVDVPEQELSNQGQIKIAALQ
ncbi:putative pilus assembly protein FilE [Acinetobacter sp. ANC5681]|uniref:putative pilus assembly protein FilE n=1 Tax=Acinetobacter sp. ANC5681 TaxID=2929504 RepID=UPI00201ABBAE|nr:putative pilus assembly protein FilE [Acinetobacter sp. ANC5681]MCL5768612.1 putative pilus assembly protein FilE [Acinetobacter sp. ANC5681]